MFFYKVEGHMLKLSSFGRGKTIRPKKSLTSLLHAALQLVAQCTRYGQKEAQIPSPPLQGKLNITAHSQRVRRDGAFFFGNGGSLGKGQNEMEGASLWPYIFPTRGEGPKSGKLSAVKMWWQPAILLPSVNLLPLTPHGTSPGAL